MTLLTDTIPIIVYPCHSLLTLTNSCWWDWLMWPWRVKMLVWFPNLLAAGRLFQVRWGPRQKDANSKLVEVGTVADVNAEKCVEGILVCICCWCLRFWSLSWVDMLMFGWDFEVDAWSRFWRWNLINFVWTCDMNSTLGSVVPLAMFVHMSRP